MRGKGNKEEFLPIKDAIRGLLNSYHIESKFDEAQVVASWERLVGAPIARRTQKVYIKNKVLYVEFKTAAMKNDFLLHKPKVLDVFQKEFGHPVIRDIVIL
jgi:predicted nucleic acid-binding Zn ribbon protein